MILRVVLVLRLDLVQVLLKRFPSGRRQHGHAIFLAFAISDQNLVRSKSMSFTLRRRHSISRRPTP